MTPPPFLFLSKRYGLENPSIRNCESGKVSCSLVSVMIKISNVPFTRTFNSSNLLGNELMLRLPMITLFMFSILAFLILDKESAIILELTHKSFLLLCLDFDL